MILSPIPQRHSKMAARFATTEFPSMSAQQKYPIADSKQYVATVVAWIMLCQASCLYFPYTMSKTSVTTLGSRGHLQPVCRCNISLNLT